MQDEAFEWDDEKAAENFRRHDVTFEQAKKAFSDPFGIELIDDREDYGEERLILIAMAEGKLLTVAYTERQDRHRLISARHATRHEEDGYFTQNDPGRD
jgi:uncharacterized DUF497 family protein